MPSRSDATRRTRPPASARLTVDEWTNELRIELAQALGVILDIAHRENFDLALDIEECALILEGRKEGS